MITFNYTDNTLAENTNASVTVTADVDHLDAQVDAFRLFLALIGHHADNVERVVVRGREERQALPEQLELFPEEAS